MAEPPPPTPPPPSNIDLCSILSESRRILKAHTHHFLALQLLFILPVSLSVSLYPYINHFFFPTTTTATTITTTSNSFSFLQQNPSIKPLIIFTLLYILIVSTFSNLATGSITHSVYHGYYGQPVTLSSSIKAAFIPFFPLLSTTLVRGFIMTAINLILALVMFALLKATQVFYSSSYFIIALTLVYVLVILLISFYLGVNWIFADVVVVVESRWGAEPLKRSRDLVKGMKRVALKLLLLFGFLGSINTWRSMITPGESASDYKSKSLVFYLSIGVTCYLYMVIMLYSLAANTVFYIYAKAQHGQIAEEFAGEYVSLPFDDDIGKVHRVASIV